MPGVDTTLLVSFNTSFSNSFWRRMKVSIFLQGLLLIGDFFGLGLHLRHLFLPFLLVFLEDLQQLLALILGIHVLMELLPYLFLRLVSPLMVDIMHHEHPQQKVILHAYNSLGLFGARVW